MLCCSTVWLWCRSGHHSLSPTAEECHDLAHGRRSKLQDFESRLIEGTFKLIFICLVFIYYCIYIFLYFLKYIICTYIHTCIHAHTYVQYAYMNI